MTALYHDDPLGHNLVTASSPPPPPLLLFAFSSRFNLRRSG